MEHPVFIDQISFSLCANEQFNQAVAETNPAGSLSHAGKKIAEDLLGHCHVLGSGGERCGVSGGESKPTKL